MSSMPTSSITAKQRDNRRSRDGSDVALSALTSLQQQVRDTQRQLRQLRCLVDDENDGGQHHQHRGPEVNHDNRSSDGVGLLTIDAGSKAPLVGQRKQQQHNGMCRLKSLDARVQTQLIQLAELLQRRPIDIQLIEAMFREQRNITEDLQAEIEEHQNGHVSLPRQRAPVPSNDTEFAQRMDIKPASASCLELVSTLGSLQAWLNETLEQIRHQQTLGGDLVSLQQQYEHLEYIWRQLEDKRDTIESALDASRAQLRTEGAENLQLTVDIRDDSDEGNTGSGQDSQLVVNKLYRRSRHVTQKWAQIKAKVFEWERMLDNMVEKMRIFQETLDEVFVHLMELEETVRWSPVKEVSVKNIQREFTQTQELHRHVMSFKTSVDHCNNMANHFQNVGIVLSHRNVSRLEDLNSRWRTLVALTEERLNSLKDSMTEVQCGPQVVTSSVYLDQCWERALTSNNVPYYINHDKETTQWDHPQMTNVMQQLAELNCVRFSAYRTAMKLRVLQHRLGMDELSLERALKVLASRVTHQNDAALGISEVINCISTLFEQPVGNHADKTVVTLITDLILNWLLNTFDNVRSGCIRVLSFKVAIIIMSKANVEDKYKNLFALVSDSRKLIDQQRLASLLHECVQIPRQLGESLSFGGNNVEPSVKSCFEKVNNGIEIDIDQFLEWMKLEPQSLVWIPVLHRLIAAESAKHHVKCSVCKLFPIVGFRYRCLKCFNFDMCQNCFFSGRKSKSHKLTHPMQEYSTATTSGEDVRDFTKTLKNKFRSKQYFRKHPRLGYLPVESLQDFNESPPSSSPRHHLSMHTLDMHSRFESYANKLAEVEQRQRATLVPDSGSEDEHSLIAHYCHSLHGNDQPHSHVLKSPMQIVMAMDVDQRTELQTMILDLEEENRMLQVEYDQLRQAHGNCYSPFASLGCTAVDGDCNAQDVDLASGHEADMYVEAKLLRQHKGRLEARMRILEEHNQQLESQLSRLRQLVDNPNADTRIVTFPPSFMNDRTRSLSESPPQGSLHRPVPPNFTSGSSLYYNGHQDLTGKDDALSGVDDLTEMMKNVSQLYSTKDPTGGRNVGNLFHVAGEVGKAVGTLVNIMTDDEDSDDEGQRRRPAPRVCHQ